MSLSSAIVVLSFSSYVRAQGYVFSATPLKSAYLAVWSFSGIIYLVQAILGIIILIFSGGHRLPYVILIIATIMSHLTSSAAIVQAVINDNRVAPPSPELTTASVVARNLFLNWAQLFLFVSIMFLLLNRYKALDAASAGRSGKPHIAANVALGMFTLLLFSLGVAQAALEGVYLHAVARLDAAGTITAANNHSQNMSIAFNSFLTSSVFFVIVYAVVLFAKMNRSGISDEVTKAMVIGIMPLYTAYIIFNLTFTIVLTTGIANSHPERVNFAWALLTNLFYIIIVMFLVVLGMNRSIWVIPGQGSSTIPTEPAMMMGAWPEQGYYYYPTQGLPSQPQASQPQPPQHPELPSPTPAPNQLQPPDSKA